VYEICVISYNNDEKIIMLDYSILKSLYTPNDFMGTKEIVDTLDLEVSALAQQEREILRDQAIYDETTIKQQARTQTLLVLKIVIFSIGVMINFCFLLKLTRKFQHRIRSLI
jgi:hypothetical protein